MDKVIHKGGCHCKAVRFEVRAPARVTVQRCNCSNCSMTGFLHLIVPAADFKLISGADQLQTYTFNTHVAKHLFCKVCGIKSFYVPRSNPDGFSVNLRSIDPGTVKGVTYEDFDGQHWEDNAAALAALSKA